jgi:hypothetical protein
LINKITVRGSKLCLTIDDPVHHFLVKYDVNKRHKYLPNNLIEVPTSRSGVRYRQTDDLLRVNHEDRADLSQVN